MSKPHRDLRQLALKVRRTSVIAPPSREDLERALTRVVEHAQAAYLAKRLGAHLQERAEA
jgi:hypothetical protein